MKRTIARRWVISNRESGPSRLRVLVSSAGRRRQLDPTKTRCHPLMTRGVSAAMTDTLLDPRRWWIANQRAPVQEACSGKRQHERYLDILTISWTS